MAASSQHKRWTVLGTPVTAQTVILVLAVLAVAALVGLAVLSWLERIG